MSLPGFTAEAAVGRSPRRYRTRGTARSLGPARAVVSQQSGETCMDWDCLSWCESHSQWPETCYAACQGPCDPNAPLETLPPPG